MAGATILVIDDDESLRDTIGVMLEQDGFRAVLAGDGRSGFEKAMSIKPDLVLVDLRLPGMTGIECTARLKALVPKLQIVILTAVEDDELVFLALEAGADGYLAFRFVKYFL